jgi:hypothetical protein
MAKRLFKIGDKIRGISGDIEGCEGTITAIRGFPDDGDINSGYDILLTSLGQHDWQNGKGEWRIGNIVKRNTFWKGCIKLVKGNIIEEEIIYE